MITRMLCATAALVLMSGAALAQTTAPTAPAPPVAPPAAVNDPGALYPDRPTAPSATTMGADTAGVIPLSSQTPEAQALLKPGDANVVTNGPVADTPENRARYGKPMSNAGKRSAPKGN